MTEIDAIQAVTREQVEKAVHERLRYYVIPPGQNSALAAFRYPEDADHWRYVHCKGAVIAEIGPPLPTLEEVQAIYAGSATDAIAAQDDGGGGR